jgi:transposase
VKTARDQLDILTTYAELGSYRAAAALCGTTHKTVRRVVERRSRAAAERPARPHNTDLVLELIAKKVDATKGRISAKRLLPLCRAGGYTGSARSLRRAVAQAKAEHRRARRTYRPWVPVPGEHLVFDWGEQDGVQVFCAVLAWSRWRFVRFAERQNQATTLRLLAECFELLGGVPSVLLTDRMGCLKGGVVADVMVPAPAYVAFATHYGFRIDFCEAGDPESKGVVEHLVGYAKSDLLVGMGPFADLGDANVAAVSWCAKLNARIHTDTRAVPDERLAVERALLGSLPSVRPTIGTVETRTVDTLRTVRFRSARYSVPGAVIGERVELRVEGPRLIISYRDAEIARHRLVGPGELSLVDDHYGGPARRPARTLRPRTAAELAFCDLGPVAEAFLRAAAGAGVTKLPTELATIVELERAHGREALIAALERALAHRRYRAADIRSILAAGAGVSRPRSAGARLDTAMTSVPVRPLSAYAIEEVA